MSFVRLLGSNLQQVFFFFGSLQLWIDVWIYVMRNILLRTFRESSENYLRYANIFTCVPFCHTYVSVYGVRDPEISWIFYNQCFFLANKVKTLWPERKIIYLWKLLLISFLFSCLQYSSVYKTVIRERYFTWGKRLLYKIFKQNG